MKWAAIKQQNTAHTLNNTIAFR